MIIKSNSATKPSFIFEITNRCNFECIYCYNKLNSSGIKQLSIRKIKSLFKKILSETEIDSVTIAGGEPLLHEKIPQLVEYLTNKNIKTGITTNASLLNAKKVDRLISAGISYFEVSLDSLDIETHFKLTGNRDLDQIKNAISIIKKSPAILTISTIISKLNLESIPAVIDYCFAFSIDHLSLNRFIPSGTGALNYELLQMNYSEIENFLTLVNRKSEQYNYPINISIPIENCKILYKKYKNLKFGTCKCGEKKWVIDPLGNLRICEQSSNIIGNLLKQDFSTLKVNSNVVKFRDNNLTDSCNTCPEYNLCGGGCRFIR